MTPYSGFLNTEGVLVEMITLGILRNLLTKNILKPGGVVEWFKALVLKTSVSARVPWVRIPPSVFREPA